MSTPSDTPRSNASEFVLLGGFKAVPVALARTLERELNQWREVAERLAERVEYFVEYLPFIYGLERADYESRIEGKANLAALAAFNKLKN